MRKYFILIFGYLSFNIFFASSQCIEKNQAFSVGEEMKYYAYYNWGFLWVKAGEASFSVGKENKNYLFTVKASNLPGWDWLYSLQTTHQACLSQQFEPVYMKSNTKENNNWSKEKNQYKDGLIYKSLYSNLYPSGKDTVFPHVPCSWDIINAVYIARNINVRRYKLGEDIPFRVIFDDKTHIIHGKVLKKEKIKNREGKEFDCLKCSATVVSGTIFTEGRPVYVWITDDIHQVPVLVESQITIGSIKVFLYDYKSK